MLTAMHMALVLLIHGVSAHTSLGLQGLIIFLACALKLLGWEHGWDPVWARTEAASFISVVSSAFQATQAEELDAGGHDSVQHRPPLLCQHLSLLALELAARPDMGHHSCRLPSQSKAGKGVHAIYSTAGCNTHSHQDRERIEQCTCGRRGKQFSRGDCIPGWVPHRGRRRTRIYRRSHICQNHSENER